MNICLKTNGILYFLRIFNFIEINSVILQFLERSKVSFKNYFHIVFQDSAGLS